MTPEEYWNQDALHQDQKFYTAFCLLESACGDYAIGVDLYIQRKVNWACTVFYYSLVHSVRLNCFLAMGDFPTGHRELGDLFARGNVRGRSWLEGDVGRYIRERQRITLSPSRDFSLRSQVVYFSESSAANEGFDKLQRKFERWGCVLSKARDLRNDSNYEGLLIAHEYNHQRVTRDFFRLAVVLRKAAEAVLSEAVTLFKLFIDGHQRKEHWYAYLNWAAEREGLYYLEDSLRYKLMGHLGQRFEQERWYELEDEGWLRYSHRRHLDVRWELNDHYYSECRIIDRVMQRLSELRKEPNANSDLAQQVHNNILMSIFGAKSQLMHSFGLKTDELEREIHNFAPGEEFLP